MMLTNDDANADTCAQVISDEAKTLGFLFTYVLIGHISANNDRK
jgi:hypothetical protein